MKSEMRCADVRPNVSALLDDELSPAERRSIEEHLATCSECATYAERIAHVRQTVRLQPVEEVPDLTDRIMAGIQDASPSPIHKRRFLRTAAIAAAAAFLVFFGTSVDVFDRSRDVATAAEIVSSVRTAARELAQYRAGFDIVEYGWHRTVPLRTFETHVWFAAPERFRLEIEDTTDYPSDVWPRNDVTLVASSDRWAISEPSACPPASLPDCYTGAPREDRTIVDRQPFDGNSALPTDIAIPLETLSSAQALEVVSSTSGLHHVKLTAQQAAPLLEALQPGGSWRPFHPLDRADLWVDAETWFPERLRITAGDSPDRDLWAERFGVAAEPAGELLLEARSTAFQEPGDIPRDVFRSDVIGAVASGGFEPIPSKGGAIEPAYTGGLTPYRSGTSGRRPIATYVDGMTWLKVAALPTNGSASAFSSGAEIVRVGEGEGFYLPSDGRNGRRIDVYGDVNVRVESNLPREELVEIAASLPTTGSVPDTIETREGTVHEWVAPSSMRRPADVPEGYRLVSAIRTSRPQAGTTVTLHYRHAETSFEGDGIRIVRSSALSTLPPSSEEFVNVRVDGQLARWSFERSELEWIEGSVYRAVTVPGSDLGTALQIAESLS